MYRVRVLAPSASFRRKIPKMTDWIKEFGGGVAAIGVPLTAILVGLAAWLPKILNGMKLDGLNGNVLERLKAMEEHAAVQDRKSVIQDVKIHKSAVKVTKLVVIVIRLQGLLVTNNISIPQDLVDDIIEVQKDDIEDSV